VALVVVKGAETKEVSVEAVREVASVVVKRLLREVGVGGGEGGGFWWW